MGAWASGPFDNDDAADFAGNLSDVATADAVAAVLGDALLAVTTATEHLEASQFSQAVAAAAIVALFAEPDLPVPPSLGQAWVTSMRSGPSDSLRAQAARALTRAFEPDDNEWYELWDEAGLVDEVRAGLRAYAAALGDRST